MDRLFFCILALVSVLVILLVAALIAGAGATGPTPHPEYPPMLKGVDFGSAGAPLWAGMVTGLIVLGTHWAVSHIGLRAGHWLHKAMAGWYLVYLLVFVALMQAYARYEGGHTSLLWGFPVSTSWLVYGLTLLPWIPVVLVMISFREAYYGPEEEARFRALLERRREGEGTSD